MKSSVFWYQELAWGTWTPSIKTKNDVAILTGSLNIDISSKKRFCSTLDLSSVVRVICSIYQNIQTSLPFSGRVWSCKITIFEASVSEACSEPSQKPEMELFAESC